MLLVVTGPLMKRPKHTYNMTTPSENSGITKPHCNYDFAQKWLFPQLYKLFRRGTDFSPR